MRIRRIHMLNFAPKLKLKKFFYYRLSLLDPDSDPLVRGTDPDPSIIKQK
jgi:hypothetical protein